jgi:hypothetical protein
MNTAANDAGMEEKLLGRWVGASERETLDYIFERNHIFKVVVTPADQSSFKVWGYWDIQKGSLRMGTSPSECDAVPVVVEAETFRMIAPNLKTTEFQRCAP